MSCLFPPNATILHGYTYSFFAESAAQNITCPINYVRPDPGGALLPWLYTLFLLCFHLPASVLRALRWESAQYFALALALFTVVLCIQSYTSTGLAANQVLVWMPLTLLQDVGAMVQMTVLIIERDKSHGGARGLAREIGMLFLRTWRMIACCGRSTGTTLESSPDPNTLQDPPVEEAGAAMQLRPLILRHPAGQEGQDQQVADTTKPNNELLFHALTCLAALVLLLTLVVLQIYGIYAAVKGLREATSTNPGKYAASTVKWCSPAFRDFAVTITTGNCDVYEITDASSNGIGCVSMPAREQLIWLKATIGALVVALVFELADMVIIRCAKGRKSRRGVDMDRPWLTIFGGIIMLVILLAFGALDASRLPPGITDIVWVYRVAPLATSGTVCRQSLTTPGLRGMIIGYTDGLLGGWGETFYGYKPA